MVKVREESVSKSKGRYNEKVATMKMWLQSDNDALLWAASRLFHANCLYILFINVPMVIFSKF